jgi:tRNA (adenine37-N6)-methyltransferase
MARAVLDAGTTDISEVRSTRPSATQPVPTSGYQISRLKAWHDGRMNLDVQLHIIGVVHTGYSELEATPIQAGLNRADHGTIEIADRYQDGLDGLAEFDFAWLVTWLHKLGSGREPSLTQVPFLLRSQQRTKGMFATRSPRRINPIGLSMIQILDVTGTVIRFAGVDLIDGTPVIDLKPYVARFDRPPGEPRCGWFDEVTINDRITPAELTPPSPPS